MILHLRKPKGSYYPQNSSAAQNSIALKNWEATKISIVRGYKWYYWLPFLHLSPSG